MKNRLELFLSDLTYNTKYEFLEEAKHKSELEKIAKKRNIKLPAHDLAIFKGRYAYVDRMNKNKCTLPKEEVEKALDTLPFKAIDFDHFRRNVVGTWVDATLDKDEVIAYGLFYKGNFPDDYKEIKELMEKDVLAISFEAWGKKDFGSDGSYNLTDIEFAGGALLIKSKPAFDGAEVLEMANKEKVLEFAKIMTAPENFIHTGVEEGAFNCECIKCGHKEKSEEHCKDLKCPKCGGQMRRTSRPGPGQGLEESRFYVYDMEVISRLLSQVECSECKEKFMFDILSVDFAGNKMTAKCTNCEAKFNIDLTPTSKLTKKGRKIKKIEEVKSNDKGEQTQMKALLEQYKKSSIDEVLQEIAKVDLNRELSKEELDKAKTKATEKGENITEQDVKAIVAEVTKVEEKDEAKDKEISKLKDEVKSKDDEIAKLKKDVENITNEVAEFKRAKEAREKAERDAKIKERKDKLGELARDMKDEDILNDDKFNLKVLQKENAKMKSALEKADIKVELEVGTETKDNKDPIVEKSETIRELAFGKENEE